MAMYPQVQKKAQAELDERVGLTRLPDFNDLPSLTYLRAIVTETLRWMPSSPLALPHSTTADDEYRGYHIPKGTIISPVSVLFVYHFVMYCTIYLIRAECLVSHSNSDFLRRSFNTFMEGVFCTTQTYIRNPRDSSLSDFSTVKGASIPLFLILDLSLSASEDGKSASQSLSARKLTCSEGLALAQTSRLRHSPCLLPPRYTYSTSSLDTMKMDEPSYLPMKPATKQSRESTIYCCAVGILTEWLR